MRPILAALVLTLLAAPAPAQCRGGACGRPMMAAPAFAGPACPVLGAGCACGCGQGLPCTCWAPPTVKWFRDPDHGNWGLCDGDKFLGKLLTGNVWHPYADGKFLAPCPCPYQLPAELRPQAAAPPVVYYQPAPAFQPFGGFFGGGGCVGGRCH